MKVALDIETQCAVQHCPDFGKSICRNNHSLSPWHSDISVIGLVNLEGSSKRVLRGPNKIAELQQVLDYEQPDTKLITHNGKFDLLHLIVKGLKITLDRWIADTQLGFYVLTEKIPDQWLAEYEELRKTRKNQRKAGKHSLKTLAPYFLGVEPFWEVGDHDNDEYVLKDAEYTARLYTVLETKLKERGEFDFYQNKLLPWTKMLLEAEVAGVQLDTNKLNQLEDDLKLKSHDLKNRLDEVWAPAHKAYFDLQRKEISEKYADMGAKARAKVKNLTRPQERAIFDRYTTLMMNAVDKVPFGIDYDSPKQMLWLMRDHLGYNCTSLEDKEGTGREILERLADEGRSDVRLYLEWRKTNKLLTAFLPTYREQCVDGKIHSIFNPTNTRTGRTSSERPNLQQVPPNLRSLFKSREGYSFVGYDLAAIEAKLIAFYSEDPTLYAIIKEGVSIHDYNVKAFLGVEDPIGDIKAKYPNERGACKNVGFALFYNAGSNRIRIAFAQKGIHLSTSQCKEIHQRFKESYKVAYDIGMEVVQHFEGGNVLPNLLGRPLRIENPEDCYMQGLNTLIQSSASDLLLEWARRCQVRFDEEGLDAKFIMFVHDYMKAEVKDEHVERANQIIQEELSKFKLTTEHGPIKLTADGGVSKEWRK